MYGQPLDAYYSYEAAIDNLTVIDVDTFGGMWAYADGSKVVIDDFTNYPVKALAFTTTGLAQQSVEADFTANAAVALDKTGAAGYSFGQLKSNGVVVMGFVPQGEPGETVYVAFQIARD